MNEEFDGNWDPDTMISPKKLREVVKKGGYHFMGDHIMMSLLQKSLKLNMIIFDDVTLEIYVMDHDLHYDNYIMLFFEDRIHYQLIGHFNNNNELHTLFTRKSLPDEIKKLIF